MAPIACARSVLRTGSLRNAAAKLAAGAKTRAARSSPKLIPPRPPRFLRSPVEMSCCVESLLPLHSATASAVLTSMISVSLRSYGWLSDAGNDGV